MIAFRSIALALLIVVQAATAAAANLAEGSAEEKLLGAPCHGRYQFSPETRAAQRAIRREQDAAMKQRDYATAVAMRQELIRYQCHSHFRWIYLAELYVELGKNGTRAAGGSTSIPSWRASVGGRGG